MSRARGAVPGGLGVRACGKGWEGCEEEVGRKRSGEGWEMGKGQEEWGREGGGEE